MKSILTAVDTLPPGDNDLPSGERVVHCRAHLVPIGMVEDIVPGLRPQRGYGVDIFYQALTRKRGRPLQQVIHGPERREILLANHLQAAILDQRREVFGAKALDVIWLFEILKSPIISQIKNDVFTRLAAQNIGTGSMDFAMGQ